MTTRIPIAEEHSIVARHTRLFDRTAKRSWTDGLGRLVAGVLVVLSVFASLYFLAS